MNFEEKNLLEILRYLKRLLVVRNDLRGRVVSSLDSKDEQFSHRGALEEIQFTPVKIEKLLWELI